MSALVDGALMAAALLTLQRAPRSRERALARQAESRLGEERGSAEQQGTPPIAAIQENEVTTRAVLPGMRREGEWPPRDR